MSEQARKENALADAERNGRWAAKLARKGDRNGAYMAAIYAARAAFRAVPGLRGE